MPLPSSAIVSALFESYINIRKINWSLNTDKYDKATLNIKAATSLKFINDIDNAKTLENWISILNDLSVQIRIEHAALANAYQVVSFFKRLFHNDKSLLLETLCSARAFILHEIENSKEEDIKTQLQKTKDKIWQQIHELEEKIIQDKQKNKTEDLEKRNQIKLLLHNLTNLGDFKALLKAEEYQLFKDWRFPSPEEVKANSELNLFVPWHYQEKYYLIYFDQVTKVLDPKSKELLENSFEDFKMNVLNRLRKLDFFKPMTIDIIDRKISCDTKETPTPTKPKAPPLPAKPTLPKNQPPLPTPQKLSLQKK